MENTDDEKQIVSKDPIETSKPPPSDSEHIHTYKSSPLSTVPAGAIIAPVDIVTREKIEKGETISTY